jgi:hypothetical protein
MGDRPPEQRVAIPFPSELPLVAAETVVQFPRADPMIRPITLCALGIIAAFFMPWISIGGLFSISGYNVAVAGFQAGDLFGVEDPGKTAKTTKAKEQPPALRIPAVKDDAKRDEIRKGLIWLCLVPGLALLTMFWGGKGFLGRLLGVVTGLYPWGWLVYGYTQIPKEKVKSMGQVIEEGSQYFGVGAYLTLGLGIVLVLMSLFSGSQSEKAKPRSSQGRRR